MKLFHPATKTELESLIQIHPIVVFDLFSDDCPPCSKFAPMFERAAADFPSVAFAKMNRQDNRNLAESYQIFGSPTVLFFHRAQLQPQRLAGNIEEDTFRVEIESLLKAEGLRSSESTIKETI